MLVVILMRVINVVTMMRLKLVGLIWVAEEVASSVSGLKEMIKIVRKIR